MIHVAVVGVDPGGTNTGVITRLGHELLSARVLVRKSGGDLPDAAYLEAVLAEVCDRCEEHDAEVGIEGMVHPNPHKRITNIMGLVATGVTFGAVLGQFPGAYVIRPNKHGKLMDVSYPAEIRSGVRGLGGPSGHARAAWDVGQTTMRLVRA